MQTNVLPSSKGAGPRSEAILVEGDEQPQVSLSETLKPIGFESRYAIPTEEGDPVSPELAGSLN